jgi:hypothetical protein
MNGKGYTEVLPTILLSYLFPEQSLCGYGTSLQLWRYICIQRYIYVTARRSEVGCYATELCVMTTECGAVIKINAGLDRNLRGIRIPGKRRVT